MSPASKTVGCIGYARERLHHPPYPIARLCSGQSGGLCHSQTQQSAQETPCHGSPRRHQDLPTLAETCFHIVSFQLFHCHLGPRSVHSQRHQSPLKRHELSVGHLSLQCLSEGSFGGFYFRSSAFSLHSLREFLCSDLFPQRGTKRTANAHKPESEFCTQILAKRNSCC